MKRFDIRRFALGALAAALLAFTAGAAKAEQITVTHWGALMYGAPYAVALENGYFEEAGVTIDGILTSKGGSTTVRNVLTGDLLYGETSLAAAVAAHIAGEEVVIIASGVGTVADILWVTMPDSGIASIADLKGKKVAYTRPKSVTEMTLRMSLEASGISADELELIAAGGVGDGLTLLEQGAVDAAPILEPIWSARSDRYKPVFFLNQVLPRITQTVAITTPEMIETKPDELRAVIAGRRKGVQFIYEHPKEAAAIVARVYDRDPAILEIAVNNMIKIDYWTEGAFNFEEMDNKVEGLQLIDLIDGPVDWSKLVDDSFLPPDLRN